MGRGTLPFVGLVAPSPSRPAHRSVRSLFGSHRATERGRGAHHRPSILAHLHLRRSVRPSARERRDPTLSWKIESGRPRDPSTGKIEMRGDCCVPERGEKKRGDQQMLIMLITSSQTTHTSPTRRPPFQVPDFFALTIFFHRPRRRATEERRRSGKIRSRWVRIWAIPLYDGGHSEVARAPAYKYKRSREEIREGSERRYAEEQSPGGR